jgi:hypothetical protein
MIDIESMFNMQKRDTKEFGPTLTSYEKKQVIDVIISYRKIPALYLDSNFEANEITDIINTMNFNYSFLKKTSQDDFECFFLQISRKFGSGPSLPRDIIDAVDLAPHAFSGAFYGGLTGVISSSLLSIYNGESIFSILSKGASYGSVAAFIAGAYNFYSNKALNLNSKFDEAILTCFVSEEDIVTCSGDIAEEAIQE